MNRYIKPLFCVCICLLIGMNNSHAKADTEARHISIAMRMIGHQVLLQAGDSTSRVLPVEKLDGRYKISFESDVAFRPEDLIVTIDRIVMKTEMTNGYLLEVESCETGQVVYGYEVGHVDTANIIPCTGRSYPSDCYAIFITIHDSYNPFASLLSAQSLTGSSGSTRTGKNIFLMMLMLMSPLLLIALGVYVWKNRQAPPLNPNQMSIGSYVFDKQNMELALGNNKVELSGKETDLLLLLHAHSNAILEREFILEAVWGDKGSYVGRTVDVFISKLRKKLDADPNVKIVNIRGVGYKLIVNA